jgi:light-harvesting complex I chlorophyll a/b binding protein 1
MFRAVALALLATSASAFMGAPVANRVATKATVTMGLPPPVGKQGGMDELGVLSPVGFWDPFNYATSPEQFRRYREVEIKHGRVAMAATLGYIVAETGLRWPASLTLDGSVSFSDIPNGIAAIPAIPGLGWVQIVFLVGCLEAGPLAQSEDAAPGDLGWKYFGVKYEDGDVKADKLNKELSNGRLAMFGILGMLVEDKLTGSFLPLGVPGVDQMTL